MSSSNYPEITKTIRFRLTLMYSLLIFFFTSLFVLGINVYLNSYLKSEPRPQHFMMIRELEDDPFTNLSPEQLIRIRKVRLQDLHKIQDISIISLLPISILSFMLGYYVSGKFLSPLRELNYQVSQLTEDQLGLQLAYSSDDEIGELATNFNKMSQRLKISFDNQTQFIQDASHELRTPLTIIQTNLDYALNNKTQNLESMQVALKRAQNGMKRVTKLTQYLLDLSNQYSFDKQDTNITDLINEQVSLLETYSKEKNVTVKISPFRKAFIVKADKILLGRAIYNLLENAIKYSAEVQDPLVQVVVDKSPKKITILIKDNGPGIPNKDQEKIFNRFYRSDKSRNSKTGGFGLGLAIVKKIIEEHDGKIELHSSNKGTQVNIILPI